MYYHWGWKRWRICLRYMKLKKNICRCIDYNCERWHLFWEWSNSFPALLVFSHIKRWSLHTLIKHELPRVFAWPCFQSVLQTGMHRRVVLELNSDGFLSLPLLSRKCVFNWREKDNWLLHILIIGSIWTEQEKRELNQERKSWSRSRDWWA